MSELCSSTFFLHKRNKNKILVRVNFKFILFVVSRPPSYAIIWDNTQKMVQARNQSKESTNKMLLWANSYAARNRVTVDIPDVIGSTIPALEIPVSSFFPSIDDTSFLRHRMSVIISRIIVEHVPFFSDISHLVDWHIEHQYSDESSLKTELVILLSFLYDCLLLL